MRVREREVSLHSVKLTFCRSWMQVRSSALELLYFGY